MKSLVLYPYPVEYDGQSLQGHYLLKGLQENGVEAAPCDRYDRGEKEELFRKFNPDVVLGIGFWGDVPEIVKHPLEKGVVPVPWLNADAWVANYHEILNSLPLILATSNWVRATYIRDGVKPDNIHVAPIGYNPEIFYPRAKNDPEVLKIRRSLGISDSELMILTAGGDVTSKGAQEILKALGKVNQSFKNWKYVCKVWPSPCAREYEKIESAMIDVLDFKDKVVYAKDKFNPSEMALLLNACDVYAAPSRLEGFGMIQLEAQACGKPVISINVGGPRDTIVHGNTGFLAEVDYEVKLNSEWVYPRMGFEKRHKIKFPEPKTFGYRANTDELADYLLKLLTDEKLRAKMGKDAAEHAYKNFNYKVTAKNIINLVQEHVLKKRVEQTISSR